MSTPPIIQMRGVSKWFGTLQVLREVDLDIQAGERVVICGPSGSGKSTLIRCINRLEPHDVGTITVDGTVLDDDDRAVEVPADSIENRADGCLLVVDGHQQCFLHKLPLAPLTDCWGQRRSPR